VLIYETIQVVYKLVPTYQVC